MKKNKGETAPNIASMFVGERGNIKLNLNDETLLHHPQARLIFDVRDVAWEFNRQYGHMFIEHQHEEFNKLTHTHHALLNDQRRVRELVPYFKNQEMVYPLMTLNLFDDVVKNALVNNSAFSTDPIKDNLELIIPYLANYEPIILSDEDLEKTNQILGGMFNMFAPAMALVQDFISDSPWHIFTYRRTTYEVMLEKGIDFRIQDWMRLKKTGVI